MRFANQENQNDNVIDDQNNALIQHAKTHKKKVTHEEWIRSKDHAKSLREVLIHEAKRDLYDKLIQKQAEQEEQNQRRLKLMYEWEDRKQVEETLEKEKQLKKKERERLFKIQKKEKAF